MNQQIRLLAGIIFMVAAMPAFSHIEYYDLNQNQHISDLTSAGKSLAGNNIPLRNPTDWNAANQSTVDSDETWGDVTGSYSSGTWSTSVTVNDLDAGGWTDGLRNNPTGGANLMGDTHKVDFANFHLSKPAYVTIAVTDNQGGTGYGLNPSFSLYQGSAVYQAHDDASSDPLNPKSGFPPVKVQSTKDNGSTTDSQGILSAYRNTLTNTGSYYGQFNALGDFSVGNSAGNWTAVHYLTSVTGTVNANGTWAGNSNSNSLHNYLLPAGDYIIAFSGHAQPASYATLRSATGTSPYGAVSNMTATLTFSAVAVPAAPGECRDVSYYVDSVPGQIAVSTKVGLNVKTISSAIPMGQDFNFDASDCTFTSNIYQHDGSGGGRVNLFYLTGTWVYPAGALSMYFTLDGDISKGVSLDPDATSWGRLFAGDLSMNTFMWLLYGDVAVGGDGSVKAFSVITPSATLKTGNLTPPSPVAAAKVNFEVIGRASTIVSMPPHPTTGVPRPDKIKIQPWSLKSVVGAATMTVVD